MKWLWLPQREQPSSYSPSPLPWGPPGPRRCTVTISQNSGWRLCSSSSSRAGRYFSASGSLRVRGNWQLGAGHTAACTCSNLRTSRKEVNGHRQPGQSAPAAHHTSQSARHAGLAAGNTAPRKFTTCWPNPPSLQEPIPAHVSAMQPKQVQLNKCRPHL
jgi:hypothetical protein